MEWKYLNEEITEVPDGMTGFIYEIGYDNGMKYIGKKSFYSKITKPPLKGAKRVRKVIKESNWRKYIGSSKEVHTELNIAYKKVLFLCCTVRETTYMEVKALFAVDAIFNEKYFNKNIGGKYFDNVHTPYKEKE